MRSNYFQVMKMPDVKLLQYRVDFAPEIADDISFIRKALIRTHQEILGHYIFDGTLLYTTIPLPQVNFNYQMNYISQAANKLGFYF